MGFSKLGVKTRAGADGLTKPTPDALGHRPSKRLFDLMLTLLSAPFWVPVLGLLALGVTLESKGSAWFGHIRIGFGGRNYRMWKLRTMVVNSGEVLAKYLQEHPECQTEWRDTQKLRNDPRITRIGFWLRRFSLDELPQLWNVVLGDMSLVGPRPIYDPQEVARWGPSFAVYQQARPGLTGLWQVSGRNDTTYEERITLDIRYVNNWTLWQDISILGRTIGAVLTGRGAY